MAHGVRRACKRHHEIVRYVPQTFTGNYPISILYFMPRFAKACNYVRLNEGDALWELNDFLDDAAREMVLKMLGPTSSAAEIHINVTYIRVFQGLLDHYAKDRKLYGAT